MGNRVKPQGGEPLETASDLTAPGIKPKTSASIGMSSLFANRLFKVCNRKYFDHCTVRCIWKITRFYDIDLLLHIHFLTAEKMCKRSEVYDTFYLQWVNFLLDCRLAQLLKHCCRCVRTPGRSYRTYFRQRLVTAATFLRSCVVQALRRGDEPRHSLYASA